MTETERLAIHRAMETEEACTPAQRRRQGDDIWPLSQRHELPQRGGAFTIRPFQTVMAAARIAATHGKRVIATYLGGRLIVEVEPIAARDVPDFLKESRR